MQLQHLRSKKAIKHKIDVLDRIINNLDKRYQKFKDINDLKQQTYYIRKKYYFKKLLNNRVIYPII